LHIIYYFTIFVVHSSHQMPDNRKLAAIMFTDIVGYSLLMEKDEKMALEVIEESRRIQKSAIMNFKGEFVKESGDQLIASFHSALNAVTCAVFIQKELKESQNLNLRIGIHIGDVIVKGGDLFGDCITIASKIETLTEANCICISEHVYNYIHNIPGIEVELMAENQLSELKKPVDVYKLSPDNFPEELLQVNAISDDSIPYRFLFWQELKRRKVIKVGSMYAAASFAILEAFDILFPEVIIPVWAITTIAVLVFAGFGITIYLAWIYDFTENGLKRTEPIGTVTDLVKIEKDSSGFKKWLKPGNIIIVGLIIVIGVLVYPKIFQKDKFKDIRNDDGRISIAVMPFKNLTGDTLYNVWQEGLQNLVISTLTNSKELSVRQFSTIFPAIRKDQDVNYASLTPSYASNVAQRLNSKTFILGSILKTGSTIRINAQLMNAESEEIYKTFQMEGDYTADLFSISDSLSIYIKEYFDVKVIIDEFGYPEHYALADANSVEALRYYIAGLKSFVNYDYPSAIDWLKKSVELDTNSVSSYFLTSLVYWNLGDFYTGVEWFKKADQKADKCSSELEKLELEWLRTEYFGTHHDQIKYVKQILSIEDQSIFYLYTLGWNYAKLQQYHEAIETFEKVIEISHILKTEYYWAWTYVNLGICYHRIGNYVREKEAYELGLSVLKDNPWIIREQAISAFSQGEMKQAEELLSKYCSIRKTRVKWPEFELLSELGEIYLEANVLDSAIRYHRLTLANDPANHYKKYLLAWILIDNDIKLDEGMSLIDSALKIEPENYLYLDAKGWGLFKQGNYSEAYELINTAWKKRTFYEHRIFLHKEEVKRKISEEK